MFFEWVPKTLDIPLRRHRAIPTQFEWFYGLYDTAPRVVDRPVGHLKKILVVDDDSRVVRGMNRLLSPHYRIEVAADIASARRLLDAEHLDLLIVDFNMPDGTGLDLLDAVRASHGPPVIMISGDWRMRTTVQGRGAAAVIDKPVPPGALLTAVQGALGT